ncbi:MAG TPA: amidohydrolase/deacetylase family metallohydrolase [Streptosporangiaceae bacterium]|nr:amidohydrolase/deacetylase family metallohydrolase [Streptosporangiaceae bacterium]
MTFDLLIKGGRVIDPADSTDALLDVAISRGRIASVDSQIPATSARQVVDASGLLVLPGLIDLHTHVFHDFTYWGIDPDLMAHDSGVTTWVDAGSAGAASLRAFRKHVVRTARVRIKAFINISSIGLIGPEYELTEPSYLDVELLRRAIAGNLDFLVGIKVRMASPTVGNTGLLALQRAREAADEVGLPIMVHICDAPPEIGEVLDLLRPGDVVTHCCTGGSMKLVGSDGEALAVTRQALDRGILLDVGHGAGSLNFASAEAMLAAGIVPHTISTDIHQMSRHVDSLVSSDAVDSPIIQFRAGTGGRFDLPACMSKFLALGVPLAEVVAAATSRAAAFLGMSDDIGCLRPGARADVGLFELVEGPVTFTDVSGSARTGHQRLVNVKTFMDGCLLEDPGGADSVPWVDWVAPGVSHG